LLDRGLAFPLGLLIGVLELFATGAIYLSFIQAVTYDQTAPWWVLAVMMTIYMVAFLVPLVLAYSYRGLLASDVQARDQRKARAAKGIIGTFFMAAEIFIAASAIVTIQYLSG
jgi:threonine/homoserine/homoserine lactone efflux protein